MRIYLTNDEHVITTYKVIFMLSIQKNTFSETVLNFSASVLP